MKTSIFNLINKMSFSRKIILAFLVAILLGSVLLYMPFSLKEGQKISFLTSVFTITSAVCVTGLSVIDIGSVLSFKGQIILLIFIQLGGLGVMTFSSLIFLLIGKKISYKEKILVKEERNAEHNGEIIDFIKNIIKIVLIIEIIGAVLLTFEFLKTYDISTAIYYGIFHSISAFCNAGFALFSNSLEGYTGSILMNLTISFLIILGGIGFAVINSSISFLKNDIKRFSLTSKVAILMSLLLIILGTVFFFLLEYSNASTLKNLNFFDKLLASFFQSVTTRTAGFNTVSMATLKPGTVFVFCIFMFIGASPGSTGGGIKTTTIGIVIFYVFGFIQGKENLNLFKRRISWDVLNRALSIIMISIGYVSIIIILIMSIENISFEKVVFEVISAFATVGLSMGITANLSSISQILIIITMFVGRLGPMTFALALGETKTKKNLKYPKENILVG